MPAVETDPDAYVALIASLPSRETLFVAKQAPLSRLKLNQRLRVLSDEDSAALKMIEDALDWRSLPMKVTEQDVISRSRRILQHVDNETLQQIVRDRLEIRTCIAALRRRALGEGAPSKETPWGIGRWVDHIARNWTEPTFRLDGVFPWLREANRLMREGDTVALERLVLAEADKRLRRLAGEHLFDFEAVVIYVLQWSMVDRWSRYNAEVAVRRFDDLTEAGLGRFASLSFEGEG